MFLINLKNIYTPEVQGGEQEAVCSLDREERCDVTKVQICEIMRLVSTFKKNKMKIVTVTTTTTIAIIIIIIIIIIIVIVVIIIINVL